MAAIWTALKASVRGAVHERDGRPNQDAVGLGRSGSRLAPLVLAVADGHGSARSFRSDRGSAFATACALDTLAGLVRRAGPGAPLSRLRRQMASHWPRMVVSRWRKMVWKDLRREPFTAFEFAPFPEAPPVAAPGHELPFGAYLAYGATLVMAAVTRRHIFYAQLGDGDILVVHEDGRVSRPWPRDHAFFATETISLCSPAAFRHFRTRVDPLRSGSAPALVLLATDGYANCFNDDDGFFQVGADLLDYLREEGPAFVEEKLGPWLRESSRDGSGDDITVGLAVRLGALHGVRSKPVAIPA
jgi:serine/threonine protein phosphatase PrpC